MLSKTHWLNLFKCVHYMQRWYVDDLSERGLWQLDIGYRGCIGYFPLGRLCKFCTSYSGPSVLDDWFDWRSASPLLLGVSPFTLLVSWGQGLWRPSLSVLFSDTWCFWSHVSLFHEEEDSFLLEGLVVLLSCLQISLYSKCLFEHREKD